MNTVLFLSPHLDDAVFSCAGMIQQEVAAGRRALIVTIFSHGGREHTSRRAEDRLAAELLGAKTCWLGLRDAPWRNSYYRGFREIVLGTAPGDSHRPVVSALASVVRSEQPCAVLAPLGVGTHIDHRLAFQAARMSVPAPLLRFYEDRPYTLASGAAALRLRELGFQSSKFDSSAFLASFRRLPHVRRYLPPGAERRACEALILSSSERKPLGQTECSVVSLSASESRLALDAAVSYASQWVDFGGSRAAWRRRDRLHAQTLGTRAPRAERYWTIP